jgi:hypothetical protein
VIDFKHGLPAVPADHSSQPIRTFESGISTCRGRFGSPTARTLRSGRAKCSNFAKSAAILQKHKQARFSMSVTSGLGVCGGVENIDVSSDRVENPIQLKRHYEQSEATQGECHATPSMLSRNNSTRCTPSPMSRIEMSNVPPQHSSLVIESFSMLRDWP